MGGVLLNTSIINNNIISAGVQNRFGFNTTDVKDKNFGDYLKQAVNNANEAIIKADNISNQFAAGKTDDIPRVLVEMEKADIAFQFTLQVRNKIIDTYNEIMRMQV